MPFDMFIPDKNLFMAKNDTDILNPPWIKQVSPPVSGSSNINVGLTERIISVSGGLLLAYWGVNNKKPLSPVILPWPLQPASCSTGAQQVIVRLIQQLAEIPLNKTLHRLMLQVPLP